MLSTTYSKAKINMHIKMLKNGLDIKVDFAKSLTYKQMVFSY